MAALSAPPFSISFSIRSISFAQQRSFISPSFRHVQLSASRLPSVLSPGRSTVSVRCASSLPPDFKRIVDHTNSSSPVVVYSKSYCPYCSQVKSLFKQLGVEANVLELDEYKDGQAVQDALFKLTGQRTVPNVFIGGVHVGGCDDTMALKSTGQLATLLESAGVKVSK